MPRESTQKNRADESVAHLERNQQAIEEEKPHVYNQEANFQELDADEHKPVESYEKSDSDSLHIKKESYSALWHSIFEEGEGSAGSFNLIRSGTELHHVGEDNFTVVTNSSFTLRYVEQKRKEIEKLMERQIGRHLKLICRLKEDLLQEKDEDSETEKIAREAGKLLGIDIEIE